MDNCVNEFIDIQIVVERHTGKSQVLERYWEHKKSGKKYKVFDSATKIKFNGEWYHAISYRTLDGRATPGDRHSDAVFHRTHQDFFDSFVPVL